jgi:hypothetical protein
MSAVPASRGARAVLRAPWVPRLLLASQVGRLPLGSAPIALLLFARQSATLTMAGLVVAAYTAGMAVSAPLLARGVDRWSQRPVLFGSVALSSAGFLLVALGDGRSAPGGPGSPPWPEAQRPVAAQPRRWWVRRLPDSARLRWRPACGCCGPSWCRRMRSPPRTPWTSPCRN